MYLAFTLAGCAACAACAQGVDPADLPGAVRDAGAGDGGVIPGRDGPASPDAGELSEVGLLLSEVALAPTEGEFIEIVNPTTEPVLLTDYFLADTGVYFQLPAGRPSVDATDFIVQFPDRAELAGGAVATIAIASAAAYEAVYGAPPTYSIADGTMRPVSTNGAGGLTNGGEVIVLFRWNGTEDLVRDADILLAGSPTVGNSLIDKSGTAFDGPDANSETSRYATDARTIIGQASTPSSGRSTKRVSLEVTHEVQLGAGNGLTGDDETSEDTSVTWDTGGTNPTPGAVPAALLP